MLQPYEPCDKCAIHTGFYSDWKSIRQQTADKILAISPTKDIYVTGHSLGAALATTAAIDLKVMGFNVVALYTYGS